MRPVTPASKPEPERTSHNATPYDPARIVQSDEGVGVRIHQRLSVVGRSVEHPSSAGGLDGGSDQYGRTLQETRCYPSGNTTVCNTRNEAGPPARLYRN